MGFCCCILFVPHALLSKLHNPARGLLLAPFTGKEIT